MAAFSETDLHRSYLNGLCRMASACSDWIGRSEISVDCYAPADFEAAFAKDYGFPPGEIRPVPVRETLRQSLVQWLGGKQPQLTDSLCWLITSRLGDPVQVYRLENEEQIVERFGWGEGGKSRYYFTDDIFIAEFKEATVCFFLGNNE